MPVPYQESERSQSCICCFGVSILPLSTIFTTGLWNCFDIVVLLFLVWLVGYSIFTTGLWNCFDIVVLLCVVWLVGYSVFTFICMFCRSLFVLFLLIIVLSVLLRYTDSDYPFGIFEIFLNKIKEREQKYLPNRK